MPIKKNDKRKESTDKQVLSFFMIGFPTVLIILVGLFIDGMVNSLIQIALATYQFILIKQFLNSYYGY